jgi:hypothetical protein
VNSKRAHHERRELVFVDESGFYLLPGCVRTFAPCGQTPILRVFHTRDHLSVMSGITLRGQLFTLIRPQALTGAQSVTFLKGLRHRLDRRLLVVWDGCSAPQVLESFWQLLRERILATALPSIVPQTQPAQVTQR